MFLVKIFLAVHLVNSYEYQKSKQIGLKILVNLNSDAGVGIEYVHPIFICEKNWKSKLLGNILVIYRGG